MQTEHNNHNEITEPPDKIIYRQGEGQVQIWYDAAGNVMQERRMPESEMIDPKRPIKLTPAFEKWLREWQRLFPPPSDIKWPVPGWVMVGYAELQTMYHPELRARYRSYEQFCKDPSQIGLYCGYWLAAHSHIRDNSEQMQKLHRQLPETAEATRVGVWPYAEIVFKRGSLESLRKFSEGFNRAIHHDPFYSASGRPVQDKRLNRFEALRFLIGNCYEVETQFVSKGKNRRHLHQWLVSELKKLGKPCKLTLKATQTLCDHIGLRLRPHSK